jgi:hypothetical protein
MLEVINPGTQSRPQYEGMVGLGAQRLTICRSTRHVQSNLDLFGKLGYNPASRGQDAPDTVRSDVADAAPEAGATLCWAADRGVTDRR